MKLTKITVTFQQKCIYVLFLVPIVKVPQDTCTAIDMKMPFNLAQITVVMQVKVQGTTLFL